MERGKGSDKTYPSWGEYLQAARAIDPDASSTGHKDRDAKEWAGAACIGDALKIADLGWADGARLVSEVSAPIVDRISSSHMEIGGWGWDVTGADFDVGELMTGTPECWLTPNEMQAKPVITISANVTTSAGIPARMIELRGAAVVALTLALQAAGYIVRVYKIEGYPVGWGSEPTFHRACLSDDQGGPLDTDRLLFALAHPAAARQIGYCLGAIQGGGNPGSPLGMPSDPPKALGWHGDIYLPAALNSDANWNDEESVSRWVEGQYERLTAPPKDDPIGT
jgi:hypothetical protein